MFDAGEGAQISYTKSGLGWNKKLKMFVTHMHGDHCIGILGLLQTMSMQGRTEPVEIYGPRGIEEFVSANVKMLNFGLVFPILITVVEQEGNVFDGKEYTIHACKASHTVTAFSYLFTEKDKPGRFDVQKAKQLGVPEGKLWGMLQRGKDVTMDRRVISPDQVLGESRQGWKIGISGDSTTTPELEKFFEGCDYLVFDSTFRDGEEARATETLHSTARQAATLARNANVVNLIMTHFSARYANEDGHLSEARDVHDSVTAARDLMEVEIK